MHSQGRTEQEALDNLAEAVQLFIESCFERGTLQDVVRDCGLKMRHNVHYEDEGHPEDNYLKVPLHLVAENAQARTC